MVTRSGPQSSLICLSATPPLSFNPLISPSFDDVVDPHSACAVRRVRVELRIVGGTRTVKLCGRCT